MMRNEQKSATQSAAPSCRTGIEDSNPRPAYLAPSCWSAHTARTARQNATCKLHGMNAQNFLPDQHAAGKSRLCSLHNCRISNAMVT